MIISIKEILRDTKPESVPTFRLARNEKIGNYLADEDGRALYCYEEDRKWLHNRKPKNEYPNNDSAGIWQVFYKENMNVVLPLKSKDFSVVERLGGQKQIAYKKLPLYYYANDLDAGDIKGEGMNNLWFVAKVK